MELSSLDWLDKVETLMSMMKRKRWTLVSNEDKAKIETLLSNEKSWFSLKHTSWDCAHWFGIDEIKDCARVNIDSWWVVPG